MCIKYYGDWCGLMDKRFSDIGRLSARTLFSGKVCMNCSRLFGDDFQVQPDTLICITQLSQKHLFLSQEVAFTKKSNK